MAGNNIGSWLFPYLVRQHRSRSHPGSKSGYQVLSHRHQTADVRHCRRGGLSFVIHLHVVKEVGAVYRLVSSSAVALSACMRIDADLA